MTQPDQDTPDQPSEAPAPNSGDFRRLREVGEKSGASLAIGARICAARDVVARGAIAIGFTPNRMTLAGFLLTCGAGYCLMRGASDQAPYFYNGHGPTSWWPVLATAFLFVAGAADMLDGAIARVGNMRSRFGEIFDSTLDRFSDIAVFLGCALHFAMQENLTLLLASIVALCNSFLISYVKARSEEVIEDCSVGFWWRGERCAAVVIGCASGHVIAVVWQLSVTGLLTVWRRIDFARRTANALDRGLPAPPHGPSAGFFGRFQLWRHPRGSVPYDIVVGLNIAFIVFSPFIWSIFAGHGSFADPLRTLLGW